MCVRHSNVAVIDLYRVAGNAELFVPISCSRGGRLDLAATTATAAFNQFPEGICSVLE